ncbi:flagellar associated protein [Tribonema minus]|uniref:Flagellar associated protein n=1 Tax=Tribonema minus TaxID=303371 RepID=A0A835ZEI2_9STRA|nr:flagellar associated protein [Tribonema minus]|eukprot:TRINITY_DN2247_c0_g1_i2.p1 TRINITY_DN2247_c0_g1~~TRINITY_DN2247_c0_g1_i2.p1  ORF type:complete len:144 (+),score=50.72 TRINITY_DN2247_c0_g1_i2:159-590(+)
MNGQDWDTVTLAKNRAPTTKGAKNAAVATALRTGTLQTEKRWAGGENKSTHAPHMNLKKLDEDTDNLKHDRVDRSLAQAIQQARLGKKLTQKQLATMINEKPQVVGEYESGKALPNPQLIVKIERALGTRLPRPKRASKKAET